MAQPAAVLSILVTANSKQAQAALAKTQAQLTATSKTANATTAAMHRMGTAAKWGGAIMAGGLYFGLKKSVAEAREANKVMAQTNAVLKSTGGAAKVTSKQVENLAKKLSEKSGIDDEAIQSGENLLLTFKNIRNEAGAGNKVFDQTTKLALDMSAALGQDMKSSAIQLGKALNDPSVGLTALRRVGVSFTAQQTEQILKMQEQGDLMGAQKRILAELTTEFKGSAKAQADAGDRLTVIFNNMAEDIGQKVVPVLSDMAERVSDILSNKKLSGDQKADALAKYFTTMFSKGLDAFEDALPKIAEAGGRMGLRLAESFGKAFLDADIFGKLFLGGLLLRAVGGKGAMTALGTKLGGTFGKAFGPAAAAFFGISLLDWLFDHKDEIVSALSGKKNTTTYLMEEFGLSTKAAQRTVDFGQKFPEINQAAGGYENLIELARKYEKQRTQIQKRGESERFQSSEKNGRDVQAQIEALNRRTQSEFERTRSKLNSITNEQARQVGNNVGGMVDVVGQGLKTLGSNTNKALKAFGAKSISFSVEAVGQAAKGFQRGGLIPGSGNGDKVPVMAEPGEGFINKSAVKALGGAGAIDAINSRFPRFQTGGVVGLQPGIARLASWAADRYGSRISSGLRSGTGSLHNIGAAVDLIPPSMAATKGIFGAFKNQLAELFYDPWGGYNDGQMIGPIGGHMDHIHAAILGAGGPASGGMGRLKKMLLKGPNGPLKSMGQGSLDKAYAAARRHLSKHTMTTHGSIGNVSGPLQSIARRLVESTWGAGQWPFFNDLVQRESGWDPSAVNPSSGAAGLAQALPASKYPAGAWPYTGKSSAVKQLEWMVDYIAGRYGNPAGAIQWHDAHNWYGKGGDFIARTPQLIGVGDGGPERVQVTPLSKGGGRDNINVNVYVDPVSLDTRVETIVGNMAPEIAEFSARQLGRGSGRSRQLARG